MKENHGMKELMYIWSYDKLEENVTRSLVLESLRRLCRH